MNVYTQTDLSTDAEIAPDSGALISNPDPQDRLDHIIHFLANKPDLNSWLTSNRKWAAQVIRHAERRVVDAFDGRDPAALLAVHRALKTIYEMHVFYDDPKSIHQHNSYLANIRELIEKNWISMERRRCRVLDEKPPQDNTEFSTYFRKWVSTHSAANHPLFEFLEKEASRQNIVDFFLSDCLLNVRFFDIVVLASLGTSGSIRQEISQNLWDESGRGSAQKAHTTLFSYMLRKLGIASSNNELLERIHWQGLAGYNLFLFLGIHRKNYYLSVGSLAATELLDPPQYTKLISGCERVGLDRETDLEYYTEHITVDITHGDGWIENVMKPLLTQGSNELQLFMFGAEMRLNTCCDYFDCLLDRLVSYRAGNN